MLTYANAPRDSLADLTSPNDDKYVYHGVLLFML
jgi:hypothetical protein